MTRRDPDYIHNYLHLALRFLSGPKSVRRRYKKYKSSKLQRNLLHKYKDYNSRFIDTHHGRRARRYSSGKSSKRSSPRSRSSSSSSYSRGSSLEADPIPRLGSRILLTPGHAMLRSFNSTTCWTDGPPTARPDGQLFGWYEGRPEGGSESDGTLKVESGPPLNHARPRSRVGLPNYRERRKGSAGMLGWGSRGPFTTHDQGGRDIQTDGYGKFAKSGADNRFLDAVGSDALASGWYRNQLERMTDRATSASRYLGLGRDD